VADDEMVSTNILGREVKSPLVLRLLDGVYDVRSAVELAKALDGCFEIGG
jgi:hypothetical protein